MPLGETSVIDAWGSSWGVTGAGNAWAATWTYIVVGGDAGAGGGGPGPRRGGRRYEYLNIIDDAHLLPLYQQRQREQQEAKTPRRSREPEEAVDENDPDIVRMRQYLQSLKR